MEAIDPTALTMLREQIGDDDCRAVVDLFVDAAPQRGEELRGGDAATVARVAHTLGATARLLGAGRLAATAARVQAAAETGVTDDGRDDLVAELAAAVAGLVAWRATPSQVEEAVRAPQVEEAVRASQVEEAVRASQVEEAVRGRLETSAAAAGTLPAPWRGVS